MEGCYAAVVGRSMIKAVTTSDIPAWVGNIGDLDEARRQADALRRTIEFFGGGKGLGIGG